MEIITLVESFEQSGWVSCRSIRSNIVESYYSLEKKGKVSINMARPEKGSTMYELMGVAKEVYYQKPSKLIFIDHDPNLYKILNGILYYYDTESKPDVIIHVYGDFIIQASDWISLESLLKKFNVQFVASSTKQRELVNKCLNEDHCQKVIPFPVDFERFYYDEEIRWKVRRELSLEDDEYVFIYTGRMSEQKNDLDLIGAFLEAKTSFNFKSKLLLVGAFDDIGVPYFGDGKHFGGHYFDYKELMKEYGSLGETEVIYLGSVDSKRLNCLLNASDCFVSMSAHNDEDYGMSVAEAGAAGLGKILTEWGGYCDLGKVHGESTSFIPLKMKKRLRPHIPSLTKQFFVKSKLGFDSELRKEVSVTSKSYNSIQKVSEYLEELLDEEMLPFVGFSEVFHKVKAVMDVKTIGPFNTASKPSDLYETLYMDYGHILTEE